MKKIFYLLSLFLGIFLFAACSDSDTYADQLERETNAINAYITKQGIKVISEEQFARQNSMTDVAKNEYVLFSNTGVYMQIVSKGVGEDIKKGETTTVLCRFSERNLMTDSLQLTNNVLYYGGMVDKMSVTNTSGTFSASFDSRSSLMYKAYQTTAVPNGWLAAMPYLKIGRLEPLAHVKLIVPSSQGQKAAVNGVYPCLYDLTFQRGL